MTEKFELVEEEKHGIDIALEAMDDTPEPESSAAPVKRGRKPTSQTDAYKKRIGAICLWLRDGKTHEDILDELAMWIPRRDAEKIFKEALAEYNKPKTILQRLSELEEFGINNQREVDERLDDLEKAAGDLAGTLQKLYDLMKRQRDE